MITNCEAGIELKGETHHLIGNTLSHCCTGIQDGWCRNNNIYHNNFIENVIQASAENSDNQWDDGAEGNYWSDYTGLDVDGDGIGDSPYIIGPNVVDQFPLMAPFQLLRPSMNGILLLLLDS